MLEPVSKQQDKLVEEQFFGRVKCEVRYRDSRNGMFPLARIYRPYQDDSGQWHRSSDFSERDLTELANAQAWAKDVISQVEAEISASQIIPAAPADAGDARSS